MTAAAANVRWVRIIYGVVWWWPLKNARGAINILVVGGGLFLEESVPSQITPTQRFTVIIGPFTTLWFYSFYHRSKNV